ncbi:helix-turn-helix domain-containing protein [Virgisporangium ochraceum]
MADAENPVRAYRSELRQRQAAETRQRVVAAAGEVFSENGYQAATYAQIAKRAGVSVETVRGHGPKSSLMWAAVELASFGVEGAVDVFETDLGRALAAVGGRRRFAAFIGAASEAINAPAADVWTAVTGAAHGDPELRTHLADRLAGIRAQVERVLRWAADRGWLRTDVPFDDVVEACCVVTSVEGYVRFVRVDGLSTARYRDFIVRTVRDTILAR